MNNKQKYIRINRRPVPKHLVKKIFGHVEPKPDEKPVNAELFNRVFRGEYITEARQTIQVLTSNVRFHKSKKLSKILAAQDIPYLEWLAYVDSEYQKFIEVAKVAKDFQSMPTLNVKPFKGGINSRSFRAAWWAIENATKDQLVNGGIWKEEDGGDGEPLGGISTKKRKVEIMSKTTRNEGLVGKTNVELADYIISVRSDPGFYYTGFVK